MNAQLINTGGKFATVLDKPKAVYLARCLEKSLALDTKALAIPKRPKFPQVYRQVATQLLAQ
ncbi:hypothetical protein [Microseira sp. BLCC-F43]|jgi:hypothetical protein|uniref:hypothetical protein n=1 Tax=Microseira sp. BLCC-F43 TaxID=3153602 RepID=UPI0035B6D845